jgi:hypothetical protein
MSYTLSDLTQIARKCCNRPENAESKYEFSMDFRKLENMLLQKKLDLHVIGYNKEAKSKPVTIEDIQFISEYIKNPNVFNAIFAGDAQIVSFMLFSTVDTEGEVRPKYTDDEGNIVPIPDKDLFSMCNDPEQLNVDLIKVIATENPIYRVIVVRIFSEKNDRYEYNVNIRSNWRMVEYQRSLKSNTTDTVEEVTEETTAE